MVEIGSVIPAEVTQIVSCGVWLQYQGEKVLVLIPDLSWVPVHDPAEMVQVGQILNVKVICYNYRNRTVRASRKRLAPRRTPIANWPGWNLAQYLKAA